VRETRRCLSWMHKRCKAYKLIHVTTSVDAASAVLVRLVTMRKRLGKKEDAPSDGTLLSLSSSSGPLNLPHPIVNNVAQSSWSAVPPSSTRRRRARATPICPYSYRLPEAAASEHPASTTPDPATSHARVPRRRTCSRESQEATEAPKALPQESGLIGRTAFDGGGPFLFENRFSGYEADRWFMMFAARAEAGICATRGPEYCGR